MLFLRFLLGLYGLTLYIERASSNELSLSLHDVGASISIIVGKHLFQSVQLDSQVECVIDQHRPRIRPILPVLQM